MTRTDIIERLRATPETGADPDMIYETADEIERLRTELAERDRYDAAILEAVQKHFEQNSYPIVSRNCECLVCQAVRAKHEKESHDQGTNRLPSGFD